jgi:hypothetical protein
MKPGSLINVDDTDHKSQKPKAKSQKAQSSFHQINAWAHFQGRKSKVRNFLIFLTLLLKFL